MGKNQAINFPKKEIIKKLSKFYFLELLVRIFWLAKANLTRIAPLFKENSTQDNRNKTPNKMKG